MTKDNAFVVLESGQQLNTQKDAIDYKIQILYQFDILRARLKHAVNMKGDKNEAIVRKALEDCTTYNEMDTRLHDVTRGDETIEQFCDRFIHYYEIELGTYDENNVPNEKTTICIRALRKPTSIELKEFVSEDLEKFECEYATFLWELPKHEAYDQFDMENEADFPIFGV